MSEPRRPTQRKQGHKGKKGKRGKPLLYLEMKERMALSLTPTAKQFLEKMAEIEMCSISEVIERWSRGRLHTKPEEVIALFSEACLPLASEQPLG